MPELNLQRNKILAKGRKNKKETALLNAWLWEDHKQDVQWRNVRLGPLPTNELSKAFGVIRRWADAIYLKDGIIHIVEAKIRPKPDAIGQLEMYKELFKNTPEFFQYENFPVKLVFLTSKPDMAMADFVSKKDIKWVVFTEDQVNNVRRELLQDIVKFDQAWATPPKPIQVPK